MKKFKKPSWNSNLNFKQSRDIQWYQIKFIHQQNISWNNWWGLLSVWNSKLKTLFNKPEWPIYLKWGVIQFRYFLITAWWLLDNNKWMLDDCLMTARQLVDDCLTTTWQLPDDCFKNKWETTSENSQSTNPIFRRCEQLSRIPQTISI